jgi:ribosomal protein S18 acetylase RimI-like enzyme
MEIIRISKHKQEHLLSLQEIAKKTFIETFSTDNSEENMRQYVAQKLSIEQLSTELETAHSQFYIAQYNNEAVGYLKVNFKEAQTEPQPADYMEIERIYVLSAYFGKGIGAFLLEKALELANQQQVKTVWLGVWEENKRAIAFYEKNGFKIFGSHVFQLGEDAQTDFLMRRQL